jgi:DNA repair exonuclease SbcCD ATPase subunit
VTWVKAILSGLGQFESLETTEWLTMAELQTSIGELRERLTALLADWGAEMSMVLRELELKRDRLAEIESSASARDEEFAELNQRLTTQTELVDTLRADAQEAAKLRQDICERDLEVERLSSELASKQELIRALRRDAETIDRLKGELKLRDTELAELKAERARAEQRLAVLGGEIEALKEGPAAREDASELEAVRAELEARKSLIKGLRADAQRVDTLESQLEEKREIIGQLETSINQHANTIAELKRLADMWKKKYQVLRGTETEATSAQLQGLTETDVRALERMQAEQGRSSDRTIAIDMRHSLLEARRTAAQGKE